MSNTHLESRIITTLQAVEAASITEIYNSLGKGCKLTTLTQRLATMCREGKLSRVSSGVYAINQGGE